jgi:hypothetical protein
MARRLSYPPPLWSFLFANKGVDPTMSILPNREPHHDLSLE